MNLHYYLQCVGSFQNGKEIFDLNLSIVFVIFFDLSKTLNLLN